MQGASAVHPPPQPFTHRLGRGISETTFRKHILGQERDGSRRELQTFSTHDCAKCVQRCVKLFPKEGALGRGEGNYCDNAHMKQA